MSNPVVRERVNINLARRNPTDFGPHTTVKLRRELDTWVRNYCMESGRTFRSVVEDGLEVVKGQVDAANYAVEHGVSLQEAAKAIAERR